MQKSLGIFGVGRWGKNIARNFFELGVLNSIYDPCEDNIKLIKNTYSEVNFCNNEDDIFENPNIDKVAIVTRIPDHTRLILKALKAKKDVFVEKPLCFEIEEAELIKKIAKENNKIVMIGHILHYHPVIQKIKDVIEQGIIGNLLSLSSTRMCYGYIKEEQNSLWSLATHDISLILSIMNSMPDSLLAITNGIYDIHSTDVYNCFLNFSNKIKANIKVNWLNPYKEQKFIAMGTKGVLLFDDVAIWDEKLKLFNKPIISDNRKNSYNELEFSQFIKIDYKEPLKNECEYFLKCCEKRLDPITNVDESIRVIEIIKSLLKSVNSWEFLPFIRECKICSKFVDEYANK